jgi:hypothetical protein
MKKRAQANYFVPALEKGLDILEALAMLLVRGRLLIWLEA